MFLCARTVLGRGIAALAAVLLLVGIYSEALAGVQARSTRSEQGGLIVDLDFPPLELSRERLGRVDWDRLEMPGSGFVGLAGAPDLPAYYKLIRIPDRSDVQVTVLEADFVPLHGLNPMPNQERFHDTRSELPLTWLEDEDVYQVDAEFPGRLWELDEPMLMRDARVVKAGFYPVQVNPLTGEGRYLRHLRVRFEFEGENLVNAGSGPLNDPTPVLQQMIRPQLISALADDVEAMEVTAFNPGRLPGHYLVFANTQALGVAALQNLIEWKRRRGHKVTVVSSADITFNTTNIRNRIIAEYNSADPVDFVLLVGDTDGTYALPTDGTSYDHFYAKIVGNDILGDVAVGRLTCDNAAQLSAICNKIVTYESTPYLDNDSWLTHASLHVGASFCALSMKILSRNIAAELVSRRGYDDIDTNFCVNSSQIISWFNSGISFYNYRGYIGMDGLDYNAVLNLSQGPRTPVATIFTCSTGDFNGGADDASEVFLMAGSAATPGGAVAAMGFATASTHTRYNNVVVGGYYSGLLEHDIPEIGACLLQGKYELYQTLPPGDQGSASNFANWGNLMGDPGTCQWAGVPAPLAVAGLPSTLGVGTDHLALTVTSGGQPVKDVALCAYQNQGGGQLLQIALLTDAAGQVLLPLTGLQVGVLKVTATHHRHVPQLLDLTVAQVDTDLAVTGHSISGPGTLLPGASNQAVSLTLTNVGTQALNGETITFSLAPRFGSLVAPPQTLPNLAPGALTTIEGIALSPASGLTDGDLVPLMLTLTGPVSLTRSAWLPVAAPLPSLVSTSTPGGPLAPGETRPLRLHLQNVGSRTAEDLLVGLASNNAYYGQVASPPQAAGDLAPGGTATVDFNILVNTTTMIGYQLPLGLTWSTSDGATGSSELLAVVGTPALGDPTGPDGYGYWAFENLDNTYDMAPTYSWVPIVPSEGGQGIEVPLNDNGNEQDQSRRVNLPFPFTYYGLTYTSAMVCSNGFISFDDSGFGEVDFRNHYLPSGMGPDAMIAPMWDDHLTTGAAGVWTWFDEVHHRFVITWHNLPMNPNNGGPNTFQLILLDPLFHPTMTGDGPFLFQYNTFNDNQSAGTDFDYCSIGIKDHTSLRGMTLRNVQNNASTMRTPASGTAVFFTTSAASSLTPPELVLGAAEVMVELQSGTPGADSLLIRNDGQLPLIWSAALVDGGLASRDTGGPDAFGYIWKDNTEDGGPVYNWLSPDQRMPITFVDHDTMSESLPLGYLQYLYGASFDQVRVSPNGFIVFGAQSAGSGNIELPALAAPAHMVAAWWDDLKPDPNNPMAVWYWTNQQDSLIVGWDMVPHFNPFISGGPIKAQIVMKANGEVTIQIGHVGGGIYPYNQSGTCGLQGQAGVEGFTFIHDQDVSASIPWAVRLTPPAWVETLGPTNGLVAGGDSTYVHFQFTTVPGFPLPNGVYSTGLLLTCNDLDNMQVTIPVSMEVSGNEVAGGGEQPLSTALAGAWPNPFNPGTRISFSLAQAGPVRLTLYNLLGQEVARLINGAVLPAGQHQAAWDAGRQASGLYLAVLEAGGTRDELKLMLMK
jgi:hypothetical protein